MNNVVNSTVRNRRKAIGTRRIFKTISQFILLIHHCNQALAKILFIVSTSLLFNLKLLVNIVGSGVIIMKSLIKAGLLGTALTAVMGLTACQSSTAPQDKPHHPMMHKDGDRGHHMKRVQSGISAVLNGRCIISSSSRPAQVSLPDKPFSSRWPTKPLKAPVKCALSLNGQQQWRPSLQLLSH
jgi:hypothetical protein